MRPTTSPPTPKQLAYLKALAARTATSFAYPRTRSEASSEIASHAPAGLRCAHQSDRDSDDGRVTDSDRQRQLRDGTPAPGEIAGHGSSASWRGQGPRAAMTAPSRQHPARAVAGGSGSGVEPRPLGYTVATGERVLYGQRVDGVVRVSDHPATAGGRCYPRRARAFEQEGPGAYAAPAGARRGLPRPGALARPGADGRPRGFASTSKWLVRTMTGPGTLDPADAVAAVAIGGWQRLLRIHHHRLKRADLEDCLSQATLELLAAAARGQRFADTDAIRAALDQRLQSRIIDRQRALGGRSPITASLHHAAPLDTITDTVGTTAGDPLARCPRAARREGLARDHQRAQRINWTCDQRLVLHSQRDGQERPARFCARHGWSVEKYRKTAQRARNYAVSPANSTATNASPAPRAATSSNSWPTPADPKGSTRRSSCEPWRARVPRFVRVPWRSVSRCWRAACISRQAVSVAGMTSRPRAT